MLVLGILREPFYLFTFVQFVVIVQEIATSMNVCTIVQLFVDLGLASCVEAPPVRLFGLQ